MNNFLRKPYPFVSRRNYWKHSLVIGFFVFLFLSFFQPFQLDRLPLSHILRSTAGYGLISFLVMMMIGHILPLLFPRFYNEDSWTIGKESFGVLLMVVFIAIANYWYTVWMNYMAFNLEDFLAMLIFTLSIGTLIVILMVSLQANRSLKKHLKEVQQMNGQLQKSDDPKSELSYEPLSLASEVEKQSLELDPSKLVYLTSVGNYIDCFLLDEANNLQSVKIRNRMKVIEEVLSKHPYFFRCHRAFIINQHFIESVEGNAKGYSLKLNQVDVMIPVARSKSADLRSIIG